MGNAAREDALPLFSVEIPNLPVMQQCQNSPSLCFPAPKPTSFGFRNQTPLVSILSAPSSSRLVISYQGCSVGIQLLQT